MNEVKGVTDMNDIPDRVNVDTEEYYRTMDEREASKVYDTVGLIVDHSLEIADLLENNELYLEEKEFKEIEDILQDVKLRIRSLTKED